MLHCSSLISPALLSSFLWLLKEEYRLRGDLFKVFHPYEVAVFLDWIKPKPMIDWNLINQRLRDDGTPLGLTAEDKYV
jgi:hypothetical protein